MGQTLVMQNPVAITAKRRLDSDFLRRGVITAILSGMSYGLYTAFMTLAMGKGIWEVWYGDNSGLNAFAVMFLLSALGAATTDTCSAMWSLLLAAVKGKLGDFFRCIRTKPGLVMVGAALIGGPLASTCYVVGLQQAGSIIVPISALCPAIGAILARFLFKQALTPRMMLGIAICFGASFMIGSTGLGEDAPSNLFLGLFFGFLAALGWGIEGCVCGYGTSMIDSEIGITIRQVTSGLSNLIILVPTFSMISGVNPLNMIGAAFSDLSSIGYFATAGFFAYFAFQLWYKGNAMCGAALGMSCNGMFSFWGPFFCWLVIGVASGQEGWSLPPLVWLAAIIMVIGIFTIAMNPLDLLKKKADDADMSLKPLNYAILKYMTTVSEASPEDVMKALKKDYGHYKAFNHHDILTAMMTAKVNCLLEESRAEMDADGGVRLYFRAHVEGAGTINNYIKG